MNVATKHELYLTVSDYLRYASLRRAGLVEGSDNYDFKYHEGSVLFIFKSAETMTDFILRYL